MPKISETETVIKKIIPYLVRRGYDVDADLTFEYPTSGTARAKLGFVDILVKRSGKTAFLVEAKRVAKTLAKNDREQAISYGKDCGAHFVVLTNGHQFECLNTVTGKRIVWNGKLTDKVPSKSELGAVLTTLKKYPTLTEVPVGSDASLPFRPGLALKQLNALFARCHNTIRKIERNEDHAFSDFAKLLFLKLLEEKADSEGAIHPYSYRFYELAEKDEGEADQVKTAILSMLETVKNKTPYGDVLHDNLYLKNAKTLKKIVSELSSVSFRDSRTDSKGAAFEYFVRATLKGKKLGQYFTPRPLVELMHALVGQEKVLTTLSLNGSMRVVDPACGTGGFLVYLMLASVEQVELMHSAGKINISRKAELINKIKGAVFFGADAHEGVGSSAKMNMIIAGDGHSNIRCEDSLAKSSETWSVETPDIDLLITNPPFGTSESETITDNDFDQYPVRGAKGQVLFVQKMIQATKPGGEVCTVIDEGLLNTEQAAELRKYILEHTTLRGIIRLPDVTFKPNKINVKSSILHLIRREHPNPDLDEEYPVIFLDVGSLGYIGLGEVIRNFAFSDFVSEIADIYHGSERNSIGKHGKGEKWEWFTRSSLDICTDETSRFDLKYWNPELTVRLEVLRSSGAVAIKDMNQVRTRRGKSPPASLYVDADDGYALVVKAGTNITKFGTIAFEGDYIEKDVYDEMSPVHIHDGDILLSSTGEGTLGECAVYRSEVPAIFDGHVTLIRVDTNKVYPEFVCDYLRAGFGAVQIRRLFTGSTGLIELPPEQVNQIMVPLPEFS